jgi:hypothetical protein
MRALVPENTNSDVNHFFFVSEKGFSIIKDDHGAWKLKRRNTVKLNSAKFRIENATYPEFEWRQRPNAEQGTGCCG